KLAGIGIKIYPYLDSLSEEVINLADFLNFPIIDIHYSIPLSDIMTTVHKEVFNKQASLLERIEKAHEQFINVMLKGKGVEEVVPIIHENIKNPVVLNLNFTNERHEYFGNIDNITKKELLEDVEKYYSINSIKRKQKIFAENKILINGKYVKRMVMPIVVKDSCYGHIISWSTTTPLGGFDLSIIESASTIIALSVLQDLSVKEVEIRYRSEFFEDLISIDSKRKKKALDRAHFFNLNLHDHYIIEVIDFKFKVDDKIEEDSQLLDYIQDNVNEIVSITEELIKYYKFNGLIASKMNGIQVLLGCDSKKLMNDKLNKFNKALDKELLTKFENMEFKIGVGRCYKELGNVNKSFGDALKAVRTGRVLTEKNVITFDELGIFKILSQDYLNEELEDFYNETLKPLTDYDEKKSTELVKTLETYFEYNGNLKRMSESLFTHYNTVLYRINRIKDITNMDLDDPNDRLNLEIALKIKELLIM
ncbi:MAG TPA: helix-turn-helix domain-containing protein, partial [Tissierellales bacterium]|nr:helix-turn-helix domain-containing protein [Tissierellales bacterium]